jgi:hypothetical protein
VPLKLALKLREKTGIAKVYSAASLEKKVIFIHIPKAAGSSIGMSLFGTDIIGHYPYYIYEEYSKKNFDNFYKFCVVRNPYDRLYSAYSYLLTGGKGTWDQRVGDIIQSRSQSFSDFCEHVLDESFVDKYVHFTRQTDFIFDAGIQKVDLIIKLEELSDGIQRLNAALNMELTVKEHNKTQVKDDERDLTLSENALKNINRIYKKDFEYLGYDLINGVNHV